MDATAMDCSRIERERERVRKRETPRNEMCRWNPVAILGYVRTYIRPYTRPIFHSISTRGSDPVDGGKEGGWSTTDEGGNWKADRIRPLLLL